MIIFFVLSLFSFQSLRGLLHLFKDFAGWVTFFISTERDADSVGSNPIMSVWFEVAEEFFSISNLAVHSCAECESH